MYVRSLTITVTIYHFEREKVPQSRQHGIARKHYKRQFVLFMVRIKKIKNNNNNKESHKMQPRKWSQVYCGK